MISIERSHWSEWSKWSRCNLSKCGVQSLKKKRRKCIRPRISSSTKILYHGSRICKGRKLKRKRCKLIKCPG